MRVMFFAFVSFCCLCFMLIKLKIILNCLLQQESCLVWFSYTASFALFAVFLILQKLSKKQLFALFVLPGLSLVMFAIYTFRLHTDGFLNDFWTQGFIAKNFSNI